MLSSESKGTNKAMVGTPWFPRNVQDIDGEERDDSCECRSASSLFWLLELVLLIRRC